MRVLLVGSGAREHAIARALDNSKHPVDILTFGTGINPGLAEISETYITGSVEDIAAIVSFALDEKADLAIIGPEAPLAAGAADELLKNNIPCVGPTKKLAQVETSKGFTRDLLNKYKIPGGPVYKRFSSMDGAEEFLDKLGEEFVVKYDGLMGGKGVKVSGEHLANHDEAVEYCQTLVDNGGSFVLEEKFVGEEFSLMSFCDGKNIKHMIPVQDHKRAFENDEGPNTGGMGSYTGKNHILPFLNDSDIKEASIINEMTFQALNKECGEPYKGILYGGFMATANGVKLIEYNARFGDPEAMNLLALLKTDFLDICQAIVSAGLQNLNIEFDERPSVCIYAVPEGYPDSPVKGKAIDVSGILKKENLYYASVDIYNGMLIESGSRTVAYVGVADTLEEAQALAEKEISAVKGPLFHRKDIGTSALIQKRVDHMKQLRTQKD